MAGDLVVRMLPQRCFSLQNKNSVKSEGEETIPKL